MKIVGTRFSCAARANAESWNNVAAGAARLKVIYLGGQQACREGHERADFHRQSFKRRTRRGHKSNLLGSLLVSKFQTAVTERSDLPEEDRADFYLYIDEFPNFSTDSFAGIVSEGTQIPAQPDLAHQYIEQMTKEVREAVFGNVGSIISAPKPG